MFHQSIPCCWTAWPHGCPLTLRIGTDCPSKRFAFKLDQELHEQAAVVGMVGEGMAEAEILNAYPDLEVEYVREALRYAAKAVRERELPVVGGS